MDVNMTQEQLEVALQVGAWLLSIQSFGGWLVEAIRVTGTWVDYIIYLIGVFDLALPFFLGAEKAKQIPKALRVLYVLSEFISKLLKRAEETKAGLSTEIDPTVK
ncbi:MAG: hypothetical protein R3254_07445 [Thiomicrorhabdus sp.]|nr:hypothetical protein [Thiomicrorhabdus sp.]